MSSSSPACSSCDCRGLDRGRADGPIDLALDVVAGAVAAHVRPAELDRRPIRAERDAFDEQGRRTPTLVEEAGLSSPEEDGLEGLAGANDLGGIASGEQLVERPVLEIAGEQAREALGRQVDLLEQERLAEARRRRSRYSVGEPASMASAAATDTDADSGRAEISLVSGSRPRWRISSEKLARPAMSRSSRGWRTNVPRPRVRSMRPSRTSSSRARRTVIRLQP